MNMMFMYVPLLLILLLIAVVGILMFKATRRRRFSPKKMRWMIIGYTFILLLAAIISYSMLPENGEVVKTVPAEEMKQIESEQIKVIDAAHSGKLVNVDGTYTNKKSWSFPYTHPNLNITYLDEEATNMLVFVEEIDTKDNVIEAVHYTGNIFLDGMDMTEKKSSPKLELRGNILSLTAPSIVSLSVSKFSSGFPFRQFSNDKNGLFSERPSMGAGQDFILLRVPKDVKVDGHTNYVRAE
jgi:amino acid transporter